MRTFQVSIKLSDFTDFTQGKEHVISVYSDANNLYEAVGQAVQNLYNVYQEEKNRPFGALYVSYDGKPKISK